MLRRIFEAFWADSAEREVEQENDAATECEDQNVFEHEHWNDQLSDNGYDEVEDGSDDTEGTLEGAEKDTESSWNKKRKNKIQLAEARDCKKKIKFVKEELRIKFFEGKIDAGVEIDSMLTAEKKPLLYRISMERLDDGWPFSLKSVHACTKINEKTLKAYQDIWKNLGNSDIKAERPEVFEFYVLHRKRGRQMADPIAMWKMRKRADTLIDNDDAGKCATVRSMFRNVALPELSAAREATGKNVAAGAATLFRRSYSSMQRLVRTITPYLRKGVKKCTQDRNKAGKNPAGGMSMVAGLEWILKDVHPHNIVCLDSLTTFVNENVPLQCYLTEKKKKELESKRRGAKAQTGNGQRRCLKINLGVARGPNPLITCTSIVSDSVFETLTNFQITPTHNIIFSLHSADDEKLQDDHENVDKTSLKYRQSKMLYDECIIPKCFATATARMEFAKNVLKLPQIEVQKYGLMRLFQDGEGGIIHHIMNNLAAQLGEIIEDTPRIILAKGPNAQTEAWQVNDMASIHPEIHAAFASEEFICASKEFFQSIVDENIGLKPALKFLNDSAMSSKSKETYSNALAFMIPLIQKCVTPKVVDAAFDQAGLHPLNFGKIMHNMYQFFDDLSPVQAAEMICVAHDDLGQVFEERGVIWRR
jgi:hypothetical protein